MRINVLNEVIAKKPKNYNIWLQNKIAQLKSIHNAINISIVKISKLEKTQDDFIMRYAIGRIIGYRPSHVPDTYDLNLDRIYNISDICHNLESLEKYGTRFIDYTINSINHITPISDEVKIILKGMSDIDTGLREYGFEPGTGLTDEDPDYINTVKLAKEYTIIYTLIQQTENLISHIKPVIMDLVRRNSFYMNSHRYRPEHDDIELLYHATFFANDIVKNGFKSEKPEGRYGLGTFGDQKHISFTHSLPIAHDILRAFRELWMIAHGELTRNEIIKWISSEKMDINNVEKFYVKRHESKYTIEQTIRLYRAYLALSKIRTDPVFINPEQLVPILNEIKLDDIGIITCDVNLNMPEIEYKDGEAEFIVPPSAIIGNIKRFM